MKHTINIKDESVDLIFGYRTLKLITERTKKEEGDLSMDTIEDVLFDALQFGIKCSNAKLKINKAEFIDWLEMNYEEATEAQTALEVFMRAHSEKRVDYLKKFGISADQANQIPQA